MSGEGVNGWPTEPAMRAHHRVIMASVRLGSWMSAALDDPKVCDAMKADINEWFSAGEPLPPTGWQPIDTAPKDGTQIIAWCVHPYASSMTEPADYVGPVVAYWIDHNDGGWTWHGHLGNFTHWMPLPAAPESPQ